MGLQTICKQITQIVGQEAKKKGGAAKRKSGESVEQEGIEKDTKRPKRKKVKKSRNPVD